MEVAFLCKANIYLMKNPKKADKSTDDATVALALEILGGKWTVLIIRELLEGSKRFGDLLRTLEGISPRTLSLRLRELERRGIVTRKVFAEVPPRVEYTVTRVGKELTPILKATKRWGEDYIRGERK